MFSVAYFWATSISPSLPPASIWKNVAIPKLATFFLAAILKPAEPKPVRPPVPKATSILGELLPSICFPALKTFDIVISSAFIVVGSLVCISSPTSS